jgi:tRNA (guanosine-2'-O-)-methyltransferase
MKRDHPDVLDLSGAPAPLPAPAREVVAALAPLVTPARLARMDAVIARRTRSLIPVLEGLSDPHNGAAVLRSADAFGCHEVHVIRGRYPFAVSHQVSRGTHRWLELVRHETTEACLDRLEARGYRIFVASMEGTVTPEELGREPRAAIVMGNEHDGPSEVARARAHGVYRIPMEGFVESLNVSVAAAITLYVATRGRHGDLDEDAREEIRARFLMAQVRDSERVVLEHVARS